MIAFKYFCKKFLTETKSPFDIFYLKGGFNMKPKEIREKLNITAERIKFRSLVLN